MRQLKTLLWAVFTAPSHRQRPALSSGARPPSRFSARPAPLQRPPTRRGPSRVPPRRHRYLLGVLRVSPQRGSGPQTAELLHFPPSGALPPAAAAGRYQHPLPAGGGGGECLRAGLANSRETSREVQGGVKGREGARWPIGERGGWGLRAGRGWVVRRRAAVEGNGGCVGGCGAVSPHQSQLWCWFGFPGLLPAPSGVLRRGGWLRWSCTISSWSCHTILCRTRRLRHCGLQGAFLCGGELPSLWGLLGAQCSRNTADLGCPNPVLRKDWHVAMLGSLGKGVGR